MYLSRKQVRLMRLAHDHILEQLGAGGSPYGLKAPLARRELGDEVVTLTEIWLDTGSLSPLIMRDSAVTAAHMIDAAKLVDKYGYESRYGRIYQQLQSRKLHLRHMLFYCYCILGDNHAGELMDTSLFAV